MLGTFLLDPKESQWSVDPHVAVTVKRDVNVGSTQDAFISEMIYSSVINLYPFNREAVHLGIRTVCPLCDKPVTCLDLHVSVPFLCHC